MNLYVNITIDDYLKKNITLINTWTSALDKERIIKNSTDYIQVTLLSKELGRGTDFVSRDVKELGNGGVHVIQTFFSEQLSDKIQIIGNWEKWSTRTILFSTNRVDIEKFSNKDKELESNKEYSLYEFLNEKRNTFLKK
jgi:hypothetical protein